LEKVSFESDFTRLLLSTSADNRVSLGNYAFAGCTSLKDITFQEYVEFYQRSSGGSSSTGAEGLFSGCTALETITLPTLGGGTNIYIGKMMFYGCTSLKEVTGGKFTSIAASAFEGCENLTTVRSEASITTINASAFKDCAKLTTVASSVETGTVNVVGNNAFENCTSLTSFNFTTTTYNVTIGDYAFKGCTALQEVTGYRFLSVGQSAFEGCTALTKFEFEAALEETKTGTISTDAFKGCTALASIAIHGAKWTVSESAFSGWTAAQTITFLDLSEATDTFAEGWNKDCAATIVFAVPKAEPETEPETEEKSEAGAEA
jgi:hypothetical protein